MVRLVLFAALCLVACGPQAPLTDGGPTDAGQQDAGTDGGFPDAGADAGSCVPPANGYVAPDGGVKPTFTDINNKILNGAAGCGLCHYPGNGSSALVLEKSVAYQQLVGQAVSSADMPPGYTTRVVPGDPQHSALSAVVERRSDLPATLYMPKSPMPKLPQQQIDAINGWIANCAPNN